MEISLSEGQIRHRVREFISAEAYQYWDHGMSLTDIQGIGACIPKVEDIQECVHMTLDEYYDRGWPNGGMPESLYLEIETAVNGLMEEYTSLNYGA